MLGQQKGAGAAPLEQTGLAAMWLAKASMVGDTGLPVAPGLGHLHGGKL